MSTLRRLATPAMIGILALAVAGPAAAARHKERNTLIGVGVGALAGSLLSNGDPWATVGGAVAGGVIGNVTTHDRRRDDYRRDRYYDRRGPRRHHRDWDDRRRW